MKLHELKATEGSRKDKHRKGRGHAAGKGKQAGKGQSGQAKRSGTKKGFEGGQNPWYRRLPKRGFKNINHLSYDIINLEDLSLHFPETKKITLELLEEKRLVQRHKPVKLLAKGEIKLPYEVKVHAASRRAVQALEKAGGKLEEI